jgi:diguanylate cyclase (GGDEF)-like protein
LLGKGFNEVNSNQELDNLIKLVSNVTDAHTSALFWLDEEQNRLQLKAVYSLSEHLSPGVNIEPGSGLIGWVAKNAKPVNVGKFNHDPKTLQYYTTEENIKSFVAVPVMNNGRLVGVLSADSKRNYLFDNKHQKILNGFAQQFYQLIERQQQFGEAEKQAERYERLYQICSRVATSSLPSIFKTLLDVSRDILSFDTCVVALLNEERNKFQLKLAHGEGCAKYLDKSFPAGHGLAGLILKQKKPLLLNNLNKREGKWFVFGRQGPKWEMGFFLGLPLIYAGRVAGVLAYTNREPIAFTQQDKQLAAIMALQVAAVTSQWQMHKVKESQQQLDSVTGLLNHSFFQQRLKQKLHSATIQQPFSLLLISIGNLNKINQEHGYETGDEILHRMARILSEVAPDGECVGRFGGRTFAMGLENTKTEEAREVAQRINHIIAHSRFVGEKGLRVEISIGLASCPQEALDEHQLIEYTQNTLDLAEKKKENKICTFQSLLSRTGT